MSEEQGQKEQQQGSSSAPQETSVQSIGPRPSYWPFTLAVALCIVFIGVILQPVVLWFGVVLAVVAVIGWGLERH